MDELKRLLGSRTKTSRSISVHSAGFANRGDTPEGAGRLCLTISHPTRSHGLVDILDRVLDKGLVIAGDIKINLANVELLTIQVRLLVCSIDKAADRAELVAERSSPDDAAAEPARGLGRIDERLERIEQQLQQLTERSGAKRRPSTSME